VADVPDDRHGGDVAVVLVEDSSDVFGGFGVLGCGWGVGGVGLAAVAVPSGVEELVGAGS
jgi:hypothetical protein